MAEKELSQYGDVGTIDGTVKLAVLKNGKNAQAPATALSSFVGAAIVDSGLPSEVDALKAGQQTSAIYADTLADLQAIVGTYEGQGAFVTNGEGAGQYRWNGSAWEFMRADMLATKADRSEVPLVDEIAGAAFVLTDPSGNPSWIEAELGTGKPTARAANQMAEAMLFDERVAIEVSDRPQVIADESSDIFQITDESGTPSWIEIELGTGRPTDRVAHQLANLLHYYVGPDQPPVWPGNWLIWTQTDSTHNPIQTYIVEG